MGLEDTVVLITGGTGSFGQRAAKHLMQQNPRQIRIYSRDEKKQWEMQRMYPDFRYIIGDTRDSARIHEAMRGVDYVFHAAALKHVPACEQAPYEAFQTNTIGSFNACQAAKANGVKVFVALSTDKAVKPINSMGLSKGMMEKIVCSQNLFDESDTVFACVRYGNVMGSRGSVIPLFHTLINENKPLTLTVPSMTRFMMTLDESVDLVLHAMLTAKGGEIFVRKAPACTVLTLAQSMARKHSSRGETHPIEVVGVRPGEKLHEVLVNEYELQRAVESDTYFVVHPEYRAPQHDAPIREPGTEYTSANTRRLDIDGVTRLLDLMGDTDPFT
jgi:FlaA1/EpsC-like NDP-sugar epimerase